MDIAYSSEYQITPLKKIQDGEWLLYIVNYGVYPVLLIGNKDYFKAKALWNNSMKGHNSFFFGKPDRADGRFIMLPPEERDQFWVGCAYNTSTDYSSTDLQGHRWTVEQIIDDGKKWIEAAIKETKDNANNIDSSTRSKAEGRTKARRGKAKEGVELHSAQ